MRIDIRQLEINKPAILQRIFVCIRFCCVGRIAGYVTEATKSKTDKKASKVGGLFVSSCLILIFGLIILLPACSNALYFYETEKISLTVEARPDSSEPIQGNIGIKQRIALITPAKGEKNGEALSSISSFRFKVAPDPAAHGAFFNGFNPVLIRTGFITGKAASGLKQKKAEHAAKIVASFGEYKTNKDNPAMK